MLGSAAENGHSQVYEFLLDHGVNLNAQNDRGETALMRAAGREQLETVKFLLKHGARVNLKDSNGSTALNYASSDEVIRLLKKAGGRYGKPLEDRCGC